VLKNLVAGIYLLIEHPFVIGDRITVNAFSGAVEDIQLRYTALRTENDQRIFIPNSVIFTSPVTNLSTVRQHLSGLAVTVSDGGAAALSQTVVALRSILMEMPGVLNTPAPEVTIVSVTGEKVAMHLLFWISEGVGESASTIRARLIEQIRGQIKDADIESLDPTALAAS
jgi:small-conductance mechanosensitive channel